MRIYKYKICNALVAPGAYEIELPSCAQILDFGIQGDEVVLWALVDPVDRDMETFRFRTFWTGEEVPDKAIYMASLQHSSSRLMIHIFAIEA